MEDEVRQTHKRRAKPKLQLATEQQTYDYALNLLSYRDHSQKELQQKLTRKGATPEQAASSIAKLTDYGIMDEERYAQRVYEAWLAKRIYGRQHLLAELHKKGVPQVCISTIMEQFTDTLEAERAEAAVQQFCKMHQKKIAQGLTSSEPKEKQKLYAAAARFLASRGFGSGYLEMCMHVMRANV